MKKFAVVVVIALITILLLGSCQRQVCPAYSRADGSKVEKQG
ncbi:MAG TPA: hypothetical protein VMT63_03910 [Bacteroidales bacterium]|nr:hypothetical protein [Bacteroidales bacterium]